jgi:hypothetical protein
MIYHVQVEKKKQKRVHYRLKLINTNENIPPVNYNDIYQRNVSLAMSIYIHRQKISVSVY